ncbi:hypothetical protein [Acinetobacter sp.]|uniref:hypothetical protein n=1 Tax=Acinetobacter sp. TaxID=472 RepID=UPI0035AE5C39
MNKKSLIFGVLVTFIWLLGIYLFSRGNGYTLPTSLNELGDFLAGIFAPIAFFWLILGYIQQGKQLDQNTRALEQQEKALQLQIDEMKESVKQQKEIALVNGKALQASYEKARPEIGYYAPSAFKHAEDHYSLLLNVHNIGKGDCYNLTAYLHDGISSRAHINFLRVRGLMPVALSTFEMKNVAFFNDSLQDSNFFDDIFGDTGETLTAKIKIEYENVYGHKLEEIWEIKFSLKSDFDKMLKQYDFEREK